MEQEAIRFEHIRKEFPGVKALKDVSFSVHKGEVHALLGENGAGKSTLLNILHGVYPATSGTVYINGQPANYQTPYDAITKGVIKVHQEVQIVENLNVGQNIALGFEVSRMGLLSYKDIFEKTDRILKELGCPMRSSDPVAGLGVGDLQMMAIAKSLYHNASIISLDEPTSALSTPEINKLFKIVRELKEKGITILFISHKLDEIFEIADRITVLRDGAYITTKKICETSKEDLIRLMVGRDVSNYAVRHNPSQADYSKPVFEAERLCGKTFNNISFTVYHGEILGFAGLVGARRTELMRSVFGADRLERGVIRIKGREVAIHQPEDALKHGVGLISEDRKREGFVPSMSNQWNTNLAILDKLRRKDTALIKEKLLEESFLRLGQLVHLNIMNPNHLTKDLSGGNQQKVIVAKWLATSVDVLIFDEPTKGVDVGAKAEIYKLMEEFVACGKTIIMVSSELPEVIGMSDRIVVMKEGCISAVLTDKADFTEEIILSHAMEGGK